MASCSPTLMIRASPQSRSTGVVCLRWVILVLTLTNEQKLHKDNANVPRPSGFHADAPARTALMNAMHVTSWLGCLYCYMTQVAVTAHKMAFMGYCNAEQIARGALKGQWKQMVVDDATLKVSSSAQLRRGLGAEMTSGGEPAYIGLRGTCKVQQLLWYLDFNRICFVPFIHAFHRGVFRSWMLAVFSTAQSLDKKIQHTLTLAQRQECKRRSATMVFTNEFGRLPECPLTYGAQQVMEQLIRQLDCVLPLLFAEVLIDSPNAANPIKKSFGHLRRFAEYHMSVHSYAPHQAKLRRAHLHAARLELVEYVKMAELVLALDLLSPNLHHLICVLTDQALNVGDTRALLEMWVERMMGFVKQKTKYRTTSEPEKTLIYELELILGLEQLALQSHNLDDLPDILDTQTDPVKYDHPDNPRDLLSTFLVGSGRAYDPVQHGFDLDNVVMVLRTVLARNAEDSDGWTPEALFDAGQFSVYVYDRAVLKGQEILTARTYQQERVRDSCHVTVSYMDSYDEVQEHVGIIKSFLRIDHHVCDLEPLRVALVDFYTYHPPLVDPDYGVIHKVQVDQCGQGGITAIACGPACMAAWIPMHALHMVSLLHSVLLQAVRLYWVHYSIVVLLETINDFIVHA
ncbi:hypothetical protein DUNSADRAFT_3456 [Dunaliella salina]|uniref:Uncharacterized protein n=1 Tax=Dunaliella salina TaxID=3046 RepID=A0ABQ7FVE4_DUNSA|nr:hypothetical protein DUNSADRAFT_3456 [Dunaliella salina]|eukprot:KAF5826354.1 hypothetical protein DUNSADRAFT_3456 [Dunaliella salina]